MTPDQIKEIRDRRASGATLQSIASDYGITRERIRQLTKDIVLGRQGWIDRVPQRHNFILTDDQVKEIRSKMLAGTKAKILAIQYNIGEFYIRAVASGRARSTVDGPLWITDKKQFSDENIRDIRDRHARKERTIDIAKKYNTTSSQVSAICHGKCFVHSPGPIDRTSRTTPADIVEKIRQEYACGDTTQVKLARKYNVSSATIYNIVNHKNGL